MLLSGIIGGNFFIVKIPRLAVILVRDFLTERGFIYCNIIPLGYNNQRANFLDFSPEICYNVVNNIFGGLYVGRSFGA